MILVSYHATLGVLQGRHEDNEKKYAWCSNEQEGNDDVVGQKFNKIVGHKTLHYKRKK